MFVRGFPDVVALEVSSYPFSFFSYLLTNYACSFEEANFFPLDNYVNSNEYLRKIQKALVS
jgi:hypothetical protein